MKVLIAVAVLAAVLHWIELESVTVPGWRIRFVDARDEPLRGLPVEQYWRNYSVESADAASGNYGTAVTDDAGFAHFPERRLRASLLRRAVGPLRSVMQGGMHAAFGPQSALYAGCSLVPDSAAQPHYDGAALPAEAAMRFQGTQEGAARQGAREPCGALIRQAVTALPLPAPQE